MNAETEIERVVMRRCEVQGFLALLVVALALLLTWWDDTWWELPAVCLGLGVAGMYGRLWWVARGRLRRGLRCVCRRAA